MPKFRIKSRDYKYSLVKYQEGEKMKKEEKKMRNYALHIVLFLITLCLQVNSIRAQQTVWIEQELPQTMSGSALADSGDDLLVFTRNFSDVIFFFDTQINSWTEVNLGAQQTFQKVMASGNTAFAYSDDYIIAYSSILSQWDTLSYEGNVIDPTGVSITKGFGCGDLLAYFITDANMFYVFDAEQAQWKQYNYGIVVNASGINRFWAADVYAGAIFIRNGNDFAKNITYSLITHSFAEKDQGGWYYYPDDIMHGGYVSFYNNGVNEFKYFGYSATTNEFTSVTFPATYEVLNFASSISPRSFDLKDIYVYTCGYATGDQLNRDYFVKSYSTKTGSWHSLTFSCDPVNCTCPAEWRRGGSFSIGKYFCGTEYTVGLWKFYGTTGTHIGEIPDLFATPSSANVICGGTVAVGIGNHNLWFHNFATEQSKHKYYPPNNDVHFAGVTASENYCLIFRINTTSDTMQVFFFNGNTNNLQSIEVPKGNATPVATSKVCGTFIGGPNNEAIFYSEEKDSVIIYSFSEQYGSFHAKNYLMVLSWSTSVLFDASTAQIYEKNFQIRPEGIGNNIIFAKSGEMEFTAYSGISKNWSAKQTNQLINGYQAGNEIAIGYSVSNAKYWGYSAYNDTYYELVPEGNWLIPGSLAGGKTAIVMRTSKVYAFSSGIVNSIEEDFASDIRNYSLTQNYPNPFNTSTNIRYQVSSNAHVTIKVYDILGNEVETLVNEYKPAGRYEVEFIPESNIKQPASGIYFYQLKAGSYIQTKKLILIK